MITAEMIKETNEKIDRKDLAKDLGRHIRLLKERGSSYWRMTSSEVIE